VPSRNLKGNQCHFPGSTRRLQRLLESADVEHEDTRGPNFDGPPYRNGPNKAAVEVMQAFNFDGREETWYRARREHGRNDRARGEPVCRRSFDTRGDTFEADPEVLEADSSEPVLEEQAELLIRMKMGAMTNERAELTYDRSRKYPAPRNVRPSLRHARDRLGCRRRGDECPIEGAHTRADHDIWHDAVLKECSQHADLGRAEKATTSEDECGGILR
jgi:hypothetical protein